MLLLLVNYITLCLYQLCDCLQKIFFSFSINNVKKVLAPQLDSRWSIFTQMRQLLCYQMCMNYIDIAKRWTFPKTKTHIHLSELHSHKVLMKVCPCELHILLIWMLQPSYHIRTSSKIIINVSVIHQFCTSGQFERRSSI